MKKAFKVFLGVCVFLFSCVLLLQIDDELLPGAQALIDNVQTPEESEAYFYLMGIDAPQGKDPVDVGREKYITYVEVEHKYLNDGNVEKHLNALQQICIS